MTNKSFPDFLMQTISRIFRDNFSCSFSTNYFLDFKIDLVPFQDTSDPLSIVSGEDGAGGVEVGTLDHEGIIVPSTPPSPSLIHHPHPHITQTTTTKLTAVDSIDLVKTKHLHHQSSTTTTATAAVVANSNSSPTKRSSKLLKSEALSSMYLCKLCNTYVEKSIMKAHNRDE